MRQSSLLLLLDNYAKHIIELPGERALIAHFKELDLGLTAFPLSSRLSRTRGSAISLEFGDVFKSYSSSVAAGVTPTLSVIAVAACRSRHHIKIL